MGIAIQCPSQPSAHAALGIPAKLGWKVRPRGPVAAGAWNPGQRLQRLDKSPQSPPGAAGPGWGLSPGSPARRPRVAETTCDLLPSLQGKLLALVSE